MAEAISDYQANLPGKLYEGVRRQAAMEEKTPDALLTEWVTEGMVDLERRSNIQETFEQEVATFEQMRPELLGMYWGMYVAIYRGEVVATGEDKLKLLHEVYEQFGPVVCYSEQVGASGLRTIRMPSIRTTGR